MYSEELEAERRAGTRALDIWKQYTYSSKLLEPEYLQ